MSTTHLLAIAILGWGLGSFCYKIANDKLHPIVVEVVVTAAYIIITPLYIWWFKPTWNWNVTGITFSVVGALAMCAGSLAYFFILYKGGHVGEVTTITALYPAVTLILSCLFMGEPMNLKKGIGVCLALLSCYILGSK